MLKYLDRSGDTGVSGLWGLFGSAGCVEGDGTDLERIEERDGGAVAVYDGFTLTASCETSPEGVTVREDTYRNTSGEVQHLQRCVSRFALPGGEYEVYTQLNTWQHESEGKWTPLVAKAAAWNRGLRPCESCTPVLALWNAQTRRGMAFHVFSSCSWKITASLEPCGGTDVLVVVEAGLTDRGLNLAVAPGETVRLPKVICYPFEEKTDLGSAKLHAWFNRVYPRRKLPVIFNTWMMTFDWLDPEKICRQAELAAEAGAEYFVIDAGWFGGEGRWDENIGEWTESITGGFRGRMRDVADHVRACGMKFGLWLEPERALAGVTNQREHPEWFMRAGADYLADFSNDAFREHITKTVLGLIDRYGIEYIKFDFNAGISYDPSGAGFLRWHQGHERFLGDLRAAHPELYLENCASGGMRMDLYNLTLFDSVWPSDNHSVYDQVRIFRDTSLRLPLNCLERWPIFKDACETISYTENGTAHQLVACDDCAWFTIRGVRENWLSAFYTGGPMGLSLDFAAMEKKTFEMVKRNVEEFKRERGFWISASARVICDTPQVLAIQYASPDGGAVRVVVFNWNHRQKTLTLYPVCPKERTFSVNGARLTGAELAERGVEIPMPDAYAGAVLRLEAVS